MVQVTAYYLSQRLTIANVTFVHAPEKGGRWSKVR